MTSRMSHTSFDAYAQSVFWSQEGVDQAGTARSASC